MSFETDPSMIPTSPLSVGDLVGRSLRWVRTHFKSLFRVLIAPAAIYELNWELIGWALGRTDLTTPSWDPFRVLLGLCIALSLTIPLEFGVREVALWSTICRQWPDYTAARKAAAKRRPAIYLMYLPVALAAIFEMFLLAGLSFYADSLHSIERTNRETALRQSVLTLGYFTALLFYYWPYGCIILSNMLLACTVTTEKLTLLGGIKRVIYFAGSSPALFIFSIGYAGLVSFLLQIPLWLLVLPDTLAKTGSGFAAQVLHILWVVLRITLNSIFEVMIVGYGIAMAYLLHNEFRMRLEGADISAKIQRMQTDAIRID